MLFTILSIAGGVVAGAILALKVIAPRTSNTYDDEVLKRLEQLEVLMRLLPTPPSVSSTTDAVTGVVTRDHRG